MSETVQEEQQIHMENCLLCPRRCGVNRLLGQTGFCRSGAVMKVARAALHFWEEPCISGDEGSGAVFFSGCSLGCCYCQNYEITGRKSERGAQRILPGREMSPKELAKVFLNLQKQGANNINLVTAGHFIESCADAIRISRSEGLTVPVLYNSSGYELAGTLEVLDGLVDIYLPDFKYMEPETAARYSHAPDYPQIAKEAVAEMVRQVTRLHPEGTVFDGKGMMKSGVIVRHLVLPGHVNEAKKVIHYLHETYQERIWISLMSQYTPMQTVSSDPLLHRKVTKREYRRVVEYALSIGIANGFIQEGETAKESFIPAFNGEGVNDL